MRLEESIAGYQNRRRATLSRPRYAIDSYQSTLSGNVQLLTNTSYSVVNLKGSGLGKCEYNFAENQP